MNTTLPLIPTLLALALGACETVCLFRGLVFLVRTFQIDAWECLTDFAFVYITLAVITYCGVIAIKNRTP